MRQFKPKEGSPLRLLYGAAVIVALKPEKGLEAMIDPVRQANDQLSKAHATRADTDREARRKRTAIRPAEKKLLREVRALLKCIESTTVMRKSALARELFPRGVRFYSDVRGATRLDRATKLAAKLRHSVEEGADEVRSIREKRLVSALDELRDAIAEYQAAHAADQEALGLERRARELHVRQLKLVDAQFRVVDPMDHGRRRRFWARVQAGCEG